MQNSPVPVQIFYKLVKMVTEGLRTVNLVLSTWDFEKCAESGCVLQSRKYNIRVFGNSPIKFFFLMEIECAGGIQWTPLNVSSIKIAVRIMCQVSGVRVLPRIN